MVNPMKKIIALCVFLILAGVGLGYAAFASLYVPVQNVAVLVGQAPNPRLFIKDDADRDADNINVQITSNHHWQQPGATQVDLTITQGLRRFTTTAVAYVLAPYNYITVEVGQPMEVLSARAFLRGGYNLPQDVFFNGRMLREWDLFKALRYESPETALTMEEYQVFETTGERAAQGHINMNLFHTILRVVDTTPPTATMTNITAPIGEIPPALVFVTEIFDHSHPVTVEFASPPDKFSPGEQEVFIQLTDYYSNSAIYTATLTLLSSHSPPTIAGVEDLVIQVGSAAMFRRGVVATNAFGVEIDFMVDASQVDTETLGVYPLIYTAIDCCGLYTTQTVQVYVVDVDPENVRERAQLVLDNIVTPDMTQVEAARAIFTWVTANVGYAAGFEHRSVYESAHQALLHRRGDCFVFYSISEVLLTLAGVPNMRIDRYGGNNRHAWNLINPDGLGWHHFDTTPLIVRELNRFMFTQTQAEEFTRIIQAQGQGRDYFTFNPELYPEIVQ